MLARRLERAIDDDSFFAARDTLLADGKVGRLRGQGGQIFLTRPVQAAPLPSGTTVDPWSEAKLMAPLRAFLEGPFRTSLDLPASGACIVQDTSVMGGLGRWTRPDFILVSAMRFRLLPGAQVDLHSFELKTETGGGVLAIHEALAPRPASRISVTSSGTCPKAPRTSRCWRTSPRIARSTASG